MSMADTRRPKSRKERSERFLRNNGIMVDPGMPDLIDENSAVIKPPEQAAKRAVCALLMARMAVSGKAARKCSEIIRRFGLENELTADERRFFALAEDNASDTSDKQAKEFHWRAEMSMPLFWACGFLGENDLEFPSHETNTDDLFDMLNACQSFPEVLSKIKMHTPSEILDNADVCLRMHTACVASQLKSAPMLRGALMSEAVKEQLKGFLWLIGLEGTENWDNIDI